MGHESSNGEATKQRLRKHGNIVACYGESLAFGCIEAREVVCLLLIDDGSQTRGQRNNLFKEDFAYMSCFTGPHADTDTMTTINYAGGFTEQGADDPIQIFMKQFLKEDVDFEMPQNVRSWKQRANVNMKG